MLAYIKGELTVKHGDYVVVENNGIGYKVFVPLTTTEAIGPINEKVTLYTYFYVREDAMNLYGFLTQEELGMFELLITVSGVGPKAAMAVISAVSPSKFGLAVITDDVKSLVKAQGIGNKIAQRIILELKDKIKKEQLADIGRPEAAAGIKENSRVSEAVSALMVLGYTALEASKAVSAVYSDEMDLESIIKGALKGLAR